MILVSSADFVASDANQSSLTYKRNTRRAKSKGQVFTVQASSSDPLNLIKLKIYERAPIENAFPAAQVHTKVLLIFEYTNNLIGAIFQ